MRLGSAIYGYTVCLASLLLFSYALLTLPTPDERISVRLAPVSVEVLQTETSLAHEPVRTDHEKALRAFDLAVNADRLEASMRSFDTARRVLEEERRRLAAAEDRTRTYQRIGIAAFAGLVFLFHWRWLRSVSRASA